MTATHVPLSFGLAATLLADDTDRPRYVPPPVYAGEHHAACQCDTCRVARVAAGKGGK